MTNLKLKVDANRTKLDDLIHLESAVKITDMRDAIAVFVVDEHDMPMEIEKAKALVGGLTLAELNQVADELGKEVKKGTEVPPKKGVD